MVARQFVRVIPDDIDFSRHHLAGFCVLVLDAHLQRLPIAFHDSWQTGQLLSRATTDLSTIRRFLSFGLVYLVVNIATFLGGIDDSVAVGLRFGIP